MAQLDTALIATLLRESLQKGQQPRLTISSSSMSPLLRQGDQIILESVTTRQLHPGDILTLTTDTYLQTHRYYKQWLQAGNLLLLTRGDQPLMYDEPWPAAALIGRVIARQREDKIMRLDRGWGQWLNRQLSKLATAESHTLALSPKHPPQLSTYQQQKRRTLWFSAKLLTSFVDIIN